MSYRSRFLKITLATNTVCLFAAIGTHEAAAYQTPPRKPVPAKAKPLKNATKKPVPAKSPQPAPVVPGEKTMHSGVSANPQMPTELRLRMDRQQELLSQSAGFSRAGAYQEAERVLREAISLSPKDTPPYFFTVLAMALDKQGRSGEAYATMKVGFFGREDGFVGSVMALMFYARLAERAGDQEEAQWAFAQILQQGNGRITNHLPERLTPAQVRSYALVAAGYSASLTSTYVEDAVTLYREALQSDPRNPLAHLYLARQLDTEYLDKPAKSEAKFAEAADHYRQAALYGTGVQRSFAETRLVEVQALLRSHKLFGIPDNSQAPPQEPQPLSP